MSEQTGTKAGDNLWAKAIETIAGDNKLLNTVLKIALSPIGIVAAVCGFGYLLWKNKEYKEKIAQLETDLQGARHEIKSLEKDLRMAENLLKQADEEKEETTGRLGFVPLQHIPYGRKQTMKRKNIYLD